MQTSNQSVITQQQEKNLHRVILAEIILSPIAAGLSVMFVPGLGPVEAAFAGILTINLAIWVGVLMAGMGQMLYRAATATPFKATSADFDTLAADGNSIDIARKTDSSTGVSVGREQKMVA